MRRGRALTGLGAMVFVTGAGTLSAQETGTQAVPVAERMWGAAKMLAAVETHFAHWEGVPDLDLDVRPVDTASPRIV